MLVEILVIVLAIVVWPILVGCTFFLFTGLPVYLLSVGFDFIAQILTELMSKMLYVPILGRLARILIWFVLGSALIALVTIGIAVPFIFIACMFVDGEASAPDIDTGYWLVDFYCDWFKWLAHACNCKYILAYTADSPGDDNILILIWKAVMLSFPMTVAVMMPWWFNLKILKAMLVNCMNDK